MFAIEPRSRGEGQKELTAVALGAHAAVRHGQDARPRVLQLARDFVFEALAIYGLSAPSRACWITALYDKVLE